MTADTVRGLGSSRCLPLFTVPALAADEAQLIPPGQAKDKVAEAPITISGTVEVATDADGNDTTR